MIQLVPRISRYAQVGLLCAAMNNAIVIAMDYFGYHYALAVSAAFLVVTPVGYLLHSIYTFKVPPTCAGWLRFTTANLSVFPVSLAMIYVMCQGFSLSPSVAVILVTILLFVWNYLLAYFSIELAARNPSRLIDPAQRNA